MAGPGVADLFARYCGVVMDRFGDRIAIAVTFNEPDLPEMLSWKDMPAFIAELERATLEAAAREAGVERYRAGNVMLREDFAAMRAGMTAAHLRGEAAIKERRPDLPVGLSIAIIDDVALPGGEAVRDRKRAEVYEHWLEVAREDDFIGVQNYERAYYGAEGEVHPAPDAVVNEQGTEVEPDSLRGAVEYVYAVAGVPVFVTEHGISTADDTIRAGFIEPSLEGLGQAIRDGVPVIGYCHWSLMDNFEWIFGYTPKLGLFAVDRDTFERTPKPSAHAYAAAVRAAHHHRHRGAGRLMADEALARSDALRSARLRRPEPPNREPGRPRRTSPPARRELEHPERGGDPHVADLLGGRRLPPAAAGRVRAGGSLGPGSVRRVDPRRRVAVRHPRD